MIRVSSLLMLMLAVPISANCQTNPCPVDNGKNKVPGLVSSMTIVSNSCNPSDNKFLAKISCLTDDYVVNGSTQSVCEGTKWSPPLPGNCIVKPLPKDHKWEYIGGGVGRC